MNCKNLLLMHIFSSFMCAHAQPMNEYREGAMSTEVVVRRQKFVDGSESVLTTPPRFGLTKVKKKFRCQGNKQVQRIKNVCIL